MKLLTKFLLHRNKIIHDVFYVMILLLCIELQSCNTKQNAVYDLLAFRTEIKEHCEDYTESDWENAFDKYSDICKRLDEMQFSLDEKREIDKVKGEIAGYAATVAAQEVSNEIQNIATEIESFSDGFNKTFQSPKLYEP